MQLRVGYLQFNPRYLERMYNLHRAGELLNTVDADLVVLPELFNSGYFFHSTRDARQAAEPVPDGPTTRWLIGQAQEHEMTLVAGLAEEAGERLYNSAVVVGPEGYVGIYRKAHLYYEENEHFAPGDTGLSVFEITSKDNETYRLGVMICFDWYFPEAARTLAVRGADIIAHPSNLVLPHCPGAMPLRALENHVFTITANRYGEESNGDESLTFIGRSLICDPAGTVLEEAPATGDHMGIVTIDPSRAAQRRLNKYNDWIEDRRPAIYSLR